MFNDCLACHGDETAVIMEAAMADTRQFIGGETVKEICASDVGCLDNKPNICARSCWSALIS